MSFLISAFGYLLVAYIGIRIFIWLMGILAKLFAWITIANIIKALASFTIVALVVMALMYLFPV